MNYTGLQTAVVDYFKRGSIAARIPDWIALAEAFLFREIDVKAISADVSGTTTNSLISLPADYLSIIRVEMSQNGVDYNLDYMPAPSESVQLSTGAYGYSFEGDSIRVHPNVGTGVAYTLYYTPKISALSGSNATNWLLENASDLYLYATCLHGAAEMKNAEEEAKLSNRVLPILASVRSLTNRQGLPKSSGMQIRPRRGFLA